jgi:enoyl-CoA hydratase/carnithine racemase
VAATTAVFGQPEVDLGIFLEKRKARFTGR